MDLDRIEDALLGSTRFRRVVHEVSCSSTQDLALRDARTNGDAVTDAVFCTDHQDSGRGRKQREWHDEPGADLLVTFRVRIVPTAHARLAARLPAALPATVLRAIETASSCRPRIKWPNDLYRGDQKLAGMLIDSGAIAPDTHLVGVGINCNRVRFPPDLEASATSLALQTGLPIDRELLLIAVARSVDAMLTELGAGDAPELLALFRDRLGLLGRSVEVTTSEPQTGELTNIDFDQLELDGRTHIPLGFVRAIRPAS